MARGSGKSSLAEVAWHQRYNHDELSAIQHAMNRKLQDEAAFFAEYQNDPLPEESVDEGQLTADQVAAKVNHMERCAVPIGANHLTAFFDVQRNLLFYTVAAWEDDFTGYVIDYGTYPDQQRSYFTLRDARQTLAAVAEGTGLEGSIYAGLGSLTELLLGREWRRDDGAAMKIGRCLIDANWGHSTNVVYQFCRQSPHSAILLPSHGRFVGASSNPFSEYKRRPGDRVGLNWRIHSIHGKRAIRLYPTASPVPPAAVARRESPAPEATDPAASAGRVNAKSAANRRKPPSSWCAEQRPRQAIRCFCLKAGPGSVHECTGIRCFGRR